MKDVLFTIDYITELAPKTLEIKLIANEKLQEIKCGQFVHLEVAKDGILLRRPFCICKFGDNFITLIVAIVGKGTKAISTLKAGDKVKAIIPIGNGFTLSHKHKKIVLVGGGVGVAPLLSVPKCYADKQYHAYLGFGDANHVILKNDFAAVAKTVVCTDNGSEGFKGFCTMALEADILNIKPDVILTCGPTPMLKAVAALSVKYGVPAYMSGESHMGCGVGACLVCTCAIKQADGSVANKRACVDGPVFNLEDVVF